MKTVLEMGKKLFDDFVLKLAFVTKKYKTCLHFLERLQEWEKVEGGYQESSGK